eukprot:TRINITY_DN466_c0_g1_i2.p2 TRINITY_DN466_c0_g1~~TRINITY_DN466_c0_g1_i2.p2  ORF type:complete len:615 (-),score=110.51 TRINITY_DN466_c0_g1_i2:335-2179(-)
MAKVAASATALALATTANSQMLISSDSLESNSMVAPSSERSSPLDLEHCVVPSTNFLPHMANVSHTMQTSYEACQISCALTPGCSYFAFNKYLMQCNYADASAQPQADYEYVAGKAICQAGEGAPPVMCKTDYPKDGFPGLTAEDSNKAWPLGHQPGSLECWPKKSDGKPASCKVTTVIEDTKIGWPGVCWGLQKSDVSVAECDSKCKNDPECAGYQIEDDNCYFGQGRDCYLRESAKDWRPTRAQRMQHGTVRVLMDLKGWQVQGLSKVFRAKADGHFDTQEAAAEHCRLACYSQIECQYWSYSTDYGCWIEDVKKFRVNYPLTTTDMTRDSTFAQTSIAGEYIQHLCEDPVHASWQGADVPFCALSGYRLDPLDMTKASIEANADLCQKKCFNTADCGYFSFHPKSGKCHLESYNSLMVLDSNYVSGPQDCPVTTPGPQASCDLHPQCVAEGFEGVCCPSPEGMIMGCCGQATLPDASPNRGGMVLERQTAAPLEQKPWIYYWWPMLLAASVILAACGSFFWFARASRTKRAISRTSAEPAPADDDLALSPTSRETVEPLMDPYLHPAASITTPLPFPEAGLPSRGLPFPEAGVSMYGGHVHSAHVFDSAYP